MSKVLFEGHVSSGTESYDTTVQEAACGGLLVLQEAIDGGEDQVLLSQEACEAIAKYIEGEE